MKKETLRAIAIMGAIIVAPTFLASLFNLFDLASFIVINFMLVPVLLLVFGGIFTYKHSLVIGVIILPFIVWSGISMLVYGAFNLVLGMLYTVSFLIGSLVVFLYLKIRRKNDE